MRCKECGRTLTKDEIALHKKIYNRGAEEFFCIDCSSRYLNVPVELLREKSVDQITVTELTGREAYTIHRLLGAAWAAEGDELTFRKNESDPLRCGVRFSGVGTQRDRVAHASAPSGSTT